MSVAIAEEGSPWKFPDAIIARGIGILMCGYESNSDHEGPHEKWKKSRHFFRRHAQMPPVAGRYLYETMGEYRSS
jgi:hypothetical protein